MKCLLQPAGPVSQSDTGYKPDKELLHYSNIKKTSPLTDRGSVFISNIECIQFPCKSPLQEETDDYSDGMCMVGLDDLTGIFQP